MHLVAWLKGGPPGYLVVSDFRIVSDPNEKTPLPPPIASQFHFNNAQTRGSFGTDHTRSQIQYLLRIVQFANDKMYEKTNQKRTIYT